MKRLLNCLAPLLLLSAAPISSTAQIFPTKPITMLVVFAPGGATDVLARLVADHMGRTLGQRVIVENVSGAGGTIGGARGAQAEPDGYTLTVGSLGSHSAAPSIYRSIKYDPRELDPIGVIAGTPLYFVVRDNFPAKNFQEFQAYVKANPGKVTNGHAGVGSTNHLACLLLMHITKLELNSVAYRGEGPAIQDLIAGHVDSACTLAPAIVPHIQGGKVRGLMGASSERAALTPSTPSAPEAGVDQYIFQGWNAIFAPKGTPAPVRAKLVEALNAALVDPVVRARVEELGSVLPRPEERTPEHLTRLVRSEVERWSVVIKAAGISEP
jgi:tripartite-type tricarboxylate transporter receptor subunit TctC